MNAVIERRIGSYVKELATYYPAISLTGPRQAGKTTLAKLLFPDYRYVNFEDISQREAFTQDPRGFLDEYWDKVIFDEVQRVPEMFNYLLVVIDEDRRPGRYVLTGSQNFLMVEEINQSLTGRIGIARLLPLDFAELRSTGAVFDDPAKMMFKGFFPGPYQSGMPPSIYYADYLASYLERDITHLIKGSNMLDFRRFLTQCAALAGNTLNYSAIANGLRVGVNTVKQWVHYLEQTYVAFTVTPYFTNTTKRITKQPKLFFYDTGFLCFLQNHRDAESLKGSMQYGNLFENLVIANIRKSRYHAGELRPFAFYRDAKKLEVDYVDATVNVREIAEIKANKRPRTGTIHNLRKVAEIIGGDPAKKVVYGGDVRLTQEGVEYVPWYNYPE